VIGAQVNLRQEWDLHFGAHCHWRDEVFKSFNVSDIRGVLNAEPPIDDEDFYNATVPPHLKSAITINWISDHWPLIEDDMLPEVKQMLYESASIFAAYAMCHPRARVGKFDWSDVIELHETLHTPFYKFVQTHPELVFRC
jgi:hypothetical protein